MKNELKYASSYSDWYEMAQLLDEDMHDWKHTKMDFCYDYKLISSRIQKMKKAMNDNDLDLMIYTMRSGLARGLAGILDKRLYNMMYTGTKSQIEEYIEETG